MKQRQTANEITLSDYTRKNARSIIEYLIKLIEYQENVSIKYELKKADN